MLSSIKSIINRKEGGIMKKIALLIITLLIITSWMVGCNKEVVVDYDNVIDFEAALNAGEDLTGKVVTFTVDKFAPNSAVGFNLQTGEHLNFVSTKHPGIKEGETVTVKVTDISSMLGSYIIEYEKVD